MVNRRHKLSTWRLLRILPLLIPATGSFSTNMIFEYIIFFVSYINHIYKKRKINQKLKKKIKKLQKSTFTSTKLESKNYEEIRLRINLCGERRFKLFLWIKCKMNRVCWCQVRPKNSDRNSKNSDRKYWCNTIVAFLKNIGNDDFNIIQKVTSFISKCSTVEKEVIRYQNHKYK